MTKKRYKERIIRITEDLKEECVTEEWLRLKRLASYARHKFTCSLNWVPAEPCNCGLDALKEGYDE